MTVTPSIRKKIPLTSVLHKKVFFEHYTVSPLSDAASQLNGPTQGEILQTQK